MQADKPDVICRKLQLKLGDHMLDIDIDIDIGSGWGALVCHAARHYGATAHGVTLSEEQVAYGRER